MASKKRIATSVAAVATAAALLLGGTFAWQSVNQTALNEASDVINPGGRLHDDFYIDDSGNYNSDIYVENFADDEIFARVKLSEYMEIVINQGIEGAEVVDTVTGSKSLNDTPAAEEPTDNTSGYEYEYVTHYFDQTNATDKYWDWTPGAADSAEVYYMPTFNMNKDSLVADRNGMYVDRIGGISNRSAAQYEDYTVWADGEPKGGTEIYDVDSNKVDEVGYDFENLQTYVDEGNIKTVDATHNAERVGDTNGLISMSEWLDLLNNDEDTADYWVYDTDGWIYWSSPIEAKSTTGLLLDSIELEQVMDDTWYYAIEAVGQFITANDAGKGDGTGFYDETVEGNTVPSDDAETLLEAIGVTLDGSGDDEPETYDLILGWTDNTAGTVDAKPGDYIVVSLDESDFAEYGNGDLSVVNVTYESGEDLLIDTDYTYDSSSQTLVILNEQVTRVIVYDSNRTYMGYINLPNEEEPEDPHGFSHILMGYDPENLQSDTFKDAGYAQPGDVIPFSVIAYYNDGTTAEINSENTTWLITAVEGDLAQDTAIAEDGVLTISENQDDLTVINVEVSFTDRDGINHTKDQSFLVSEEAVTLTLEMTDDEPYYTGNWYSFAATATNESGETVPMAWSYDMIPQNHEDNLSVETGTNATFCAYDAGNYYLRAWAEYLAGHYAEIPITVEGDVYEPTFSFYIDASPAGYTPGLATNNITLTANANFGGEDVLENVTLTNWRLSGNMSVENVLTDNGDGTASLYVCAEENGQLTVSVDYEYNSETHTAEIVIPNHPQVATMTVYDDGTGEHLGSEYTPGETTTVKLTAYFFEEYTGTVQPIDDAYSDAAALEAIGSHVHWYLVEAHESEEETAVPGVTVSQDGDKPWKVAIVIDSTVEEDLIVRCDLDSGMQIHYDITAIS